MTKNTDRRRRRKLGIFSYEPFGLQTFTLVFFPHVLVISLYFCFESENISFINRNRILFSPPLVMRPLPQFHRLSF